MEIVYALLPISLLLGLFGFLAFMWALRSGQYDDMDTPAVKMLFDDEEDRKSPPEKKEP